ncbi:MAG: SAM-dependent chlorinase/fluorinase [Pseudomonadota bacterium]
MALASDTGRRPTISLTTDFGHQGPFAAVMRAVIAARCPDATVIDLTHDIPVHWPPEAGFWVRRAYPYFPPRTVHVAVVDPGVGTERDIIAMTVDGHRFLAPDNGLLGDLLEIRPEATCVRVDVDRLRTKLDLPPPSATFHGRDLFAPAAAALAAGRLDISELGPTWTEWVPSQVDAPESRSNGIAGTVISIDTFGNLITNIDRTQLTEIATPSVQVAGIRLSLASTYGRVSPGDYLALINSFDVVEIARAEGSAAAGLGIGRGAPVRISAE